MSTSLQPFEQFFDLRRLSDAGAEIAINPDEAARDRLARWLDADRVQSLTATVTLTRISPNRFAYDAVFECEVTQKSVVSLGPVPARVKEHFQRELHLTDRRRVPDAEAHLTLAVTDDDVPEAIDNPRYDLAAPILEELSLALDPYPRASGEEFAEIGTPGPAETNPFAILKKLKEGG